MKKISLADMLINLFCIILAIVLVLPFYNVVIRSFASPAAVAQQQFYLIPTSFDLTAYKAIFEGGKIFTAFGVSMFVTVVGTVISLALTICGAYVLAKKNLPGRKAFIVFILITMFFNGGLIPYYLNIKDLNLINSVFVMILPNALNTFYMIIMMNYFRGLPKSLEESAKIDGARELVIMTKIIVPISKPTLAAITLFYAVDRWNEWWNALLFISDESKYPMQMFLREMLVDVTKMSSNSMAASMAATMRKVSPESLKMATVLVTMVPIMLVYPYMQKHFAAGVMLGSLKE